MKKAIVLCSGGMDSVITAHYVRKRLKYDKITLLFFNYGQKSLNSERKSVLKSARELKADFKKIKLPELKKLSTSLININGEIKKLNKEDLKNTKKESEKWYVPCRNLIFLSYALALGEKDFVNGRKRNDIFVGFKNEGKESFSDTTGKFVELVNKISHRGSEGKCRIYAPLIKKDKEDIVKLGMKLGVKLQDTFSCYIGNKKHCGKCLACMLRKEGFYWANELDETEYKIN